MRSSNFTDEKKRQILIERNREGITVREICKKYKISIPTYYAWRRDYLETENHIPPQGIIALEKFEINQKADVATIEENKTLRRLYINLSAHNYELAKFLEKH